MIYGKNVSKYYRVNGSLVKVLENLNFSIENKVKLGILGYNGAGKSTLIRLISGCEKVTSGKIVKDIRVSWPIGLSSSFHATLSGADNTRFVSRIYGEDLNKIKKFVEDFAELGKFIDMPIRTYSAGMRARLSFALSMAMDFDCYLVDEVTAVGDSKFQKKCKDAFDEKKNTSSIIMVSHSSDILKAHCDKGAILHNGELKIYEDLDKAMEIYKDLK